MKSYYTALLLVLSLFASAQNKIVGTISDKENKALPNVIVSLPEIHKETISDENGNYILNNLPKGKFKIVFSMVGYTTQMNDATVSENETTQSSGRLIFWK